MRKLVPALLLLASAITVLAGLWFARDPSWLLGSDPWAVHAQTTTKLQVGLYWSSGAQITNAMTTIVNSKGVALVAPKSGSWPTVSLNIPADFYTITVTASAADGHPAIVYGVTVPMASTIAGFTVTNYVAKITLDSTGQHGTLAASINTTF